MRREYYIAASRRDVSTTLDMTIGVGARNDKKGCLLDATMAGSAIVTSCVGKIMSAQTIIPAEVAGIIV